MIAKSKHIHKYAEFYHDKGFDVLNIKIEPVQFLIPSKAQSVVGHVLDFVTDSPQNDRPVIIHGFSVGAYLYAEMMVKIIDTERYYHVGERLLGQVFDSPVDFEMVTTGFPRAVSSNLFIQKSMEKTLELYVYLMRNLTMKHYQNASRVFKENKFKRKSLFLYSMTDNIADYRIIDSTVKGMRNAGIEVYSRRWEKSHHVSHFHEHRTEYLELLDNFVNKIYPDNKYTRKR